MPDWPRHPKKDYQALLELVAQHDWAVGKGNGYYRARCPCGRHAKSIPITPSAERTLVNLRKWFERQPCRRREDKK